jgi:hypothetical protein
MNSGQPLFVGNVPPDLEPYRRDPMPSLSQKQSPVPAPTYTSRVPSWAAAGAFMLALRRLQPIFVTYNLIRLPMGHICCGSGLSTAPTR